MKKATPLTTYEERILRMTIDNPQIFEVPVKTVKKMLALLDVLRDNAVTNPGHVGKTMVMHPIIECLEPARDHGPWRSLPTLDGEPLITSRYCAACGMIHATQDGQPDRWRPSSFHLPDEPRVTPVPTLAFVRNPGDTGRFVVRFDDAESMIMTRDHAARFFRAMPDRTYMVPATKQPSGAQGHVPRVGSEIADMLERGDLP